MVYSLSDKHLADLAKSGLIGKKATSAYSATDDNPHPLFSNLKGMLIDYLDPHGKPYPLSSPQKGQNFTRLKPEWPSDKNDPPKYLSPKGQGCRPYFSQLIDWAAILSNQSPVFLTEGEKKADCMALYGFPAIGLAGVYGWLDKCPRHPGEIIEESRPIPELFGGAIDFKGRIVCLVFDSDLTSKATVLAALKDLSLHLASLGAIPHIAILPNEIDGGKNGADDFLVRHGREAFSKLIELASLCVFRDKEKTPYFRLDSRSPIQKAAMIWSVFKDNWRYRIGIGWHRWNGSYWRFEDDGIGTQLDRDIYSFCDANLWESQTSGFLSNAVRQLKAKNYAEIEEWNCQDLIPFRNGCLCLSNGRFIPHKKENYNTYCLPYEYREGDDRCPNWLRFLGQAVGEDDRAISLIRALFRWALLPKNTGKSRFEICWDLYGEKGTGKGTILETLRNLVGRENAGTFRTRHLTNPNVLAALLDKKVSIASDDGGFLEDVGLLNEIISNEPVLIKHLYKNAHPTPLNTFLVRAYNDFISTSSGASSQGLDRRILAMNFSSRPAAPDYDLQSKINRELSAIFNWVWAMSDAEMEKTIEYAGAIEAVKQASAARFEANNPVYSFLCESYPSGHMEGAKPRELYQSYAAWCRESGRTPNGESGFRSALKALGICLSNKINGYRKYQIPNMDLFDLPRHLGQKESVSESLDQPQVPENDNDIVVGERRQFTIGLKRFFTVQSVGGDGNFYILFDGGVTPQPFTPAILRQKSTPAVEKPPIPRVPLIAGHQSEIDISEIYYSYMDIDD
jgi:putative DNA primase/helicase